MESNRSLTSKILRLLPVLTLACVVLSHTAFAKQEPKIYPEVGKVIGTGTSGDRPFFTRTYKVATGTKIYLLDCGKTPFLPVFPGASKTGGECGGDKKLQIGDDIRFRTKKEWVYIPITGSGQTASEQKLRILSEELKPGPKLQDDTRP